MKSARRRARELALQGLYAWQIAQTSVTELLANLADNRDFARADHRYLNLVINGVVDNAESMREKLTPLLDRPWNELSPVERAVLLIAC